MAVMHPLGRKGVFFTLMALLLVTFLFTYQKLGERQHSPTRADTDAALTRTRVMSQYIDTLEQHASDSLRTSGYYTLQNLSKRVGSTQQYLTDINGSVNTCIKTAPATCLTVNQTVNASIDRLVAIARSNLSIDTDYRIERVWVTEENPFEVVFWMNITYNVSDSFASWQRTQTIRAPVDVTGIEDPAFALARANGTLKSSRNFTQGAVKNLAFNNTSLSSHYTRGEYIFYYTSPSVLQRYAGKLNESSQCCGVESLVQYANLSNALQADPRIANWSFVDYQFFLRNDSAYNYNCNTVNIGGVKAPFPDQSMRLDSHHLYNVYKMRDSAGYGCGLTVT